MSLQLEYHSEEEHEDRLAFSTHSHSSPDWNTVESAVWSGTLSSSQVSIFNKSWIILA